MTNTTPQIKIKIDGSATTERLREIAKSVGGKPRRDFKSPTEKNLDRLKIRGTLPPHIRLAWEADSIGACINDQNGVIAAIHTENFDNRLAIFNETPPDAQKILDELGAIGELGGYSEKLNRPEQLRIGDCILFVNTYHQYRWEDGRLANTHVGLIHGWIECLERGNSTKLALGLGQGDSMGIAVTFSNDMLFRHGCLRNSLTKIPQKYGRPTRRKRRLQSI